MPLTGGRRRPGRRPVAVRPLRRGAVPGQGPRPGVRRLPDLERLTGPRPTTSPTGTPWSRSASSTPGWSIFGKTNTPEFGAKGITEPELLGRGAQPVEHRPHPRRLVGRLRRRGRRRHRAGGRRQRRRRLDPDPGGLQRPGRPQDQSRPRPLRSADRRGDVRDGHPGRGLPHRARQRRACSTRSSAPDHGAGVPGRPPADAVRRGDRATAGDAADRLLLVVRDQRQPRTPRRSPPSSPPRPCSPSSGTRSRRCRRRTTTRRWPATS